MRKGIGGRGKAKWPNERNITMKINFKDSIDKFAHSKLRKKSMFQRLTGSKEREG